MEIGAGRLVVTTLRLDADNGPLAAAMLADLVRSAAEQDHAGTTRGAGPAPSMSAMESTVAQVGRRD
jgi:hypothetical protein